LLACVAYPRISMPNVPDLFASLFFRLASPLRYGVLDLISNSSACSTGPKHDKTRTIPVRLADLKGCHYSSQSDASCTLNVIVEASDFGSVPVKDSPCVVKAEILEVYVRLRKALPCSTDEFADEVVVFFASSTRSSQTKIKLVI
jgi:hypothetical protein